ncbi:MAG TPA: iron-containing alcohol dehydrogenase [Dehalococcoidia bacterium]|nr:iron-containing alcohol dehydrogenase [Dehalococcoidia bacterium]
MPMPQTAAAFRAQGYPWRLYCGAEAITSIGDELRRAGARRAFVLCGKTVAGKTDLVPRIRAACGGAFAGVYDGMDKDATFPAIQRGTEEARAAGADLLIAVGGGSVIHGSRVVAILLAEQGDPYALMTQYPEGKPAYSPRLRAPKPPIINVPTTPTSAMNRAGSALKNDALDHRMEFFDPKTRPAAIVWDHGALLTAPLALLRSTATTTFLGSLTALGASDANPLAAGDQRQAFALAHAALGRLPHEPENVQLRIDLCAAALLQNRAADDDAGRGRDAAASASYALATALHIRYHHVGQGEATAAVWPTCLRRLAPPAAPAQAIAAGLGVWREGMSAAAAIEAAAAALEALLAKAGMPSRVRELQIPEADLPQLAQDTLKNFNANPGERPADYSARMLALLHAAW